MFIKKLLTIIGCWCVIGGFIFLILNPNLVLASLFSEGLDKTAEKTGHISGSSSIWISDNLPGAIGKMIGGFLALLGVIFLILMIYGGFVWMMARGSDEEVDKGKKIIGNAIGGLIIVSGAYAITVFIGQLGSKV